MFPHMSDQARIWIYGFNRSLTPNEQRVVRGYLDAFIREWKSHGSDVDGDYRLLYDRFVIIAAESTVSGCGIDKSVHLFQDLKQHYNLDALDLGLIFFRNSEGVIKSVDRPTFQTMLNRGDVNTQTIVFNNSLTELGQLRTGMWETTFELSWHARAFRKSA